MGGAEDYAGRAPVTADVQRELAEALEGTVAGRPCIEIAAALLPTVQALIADAEKRAAAAALREAAADDDAKAIRWPGASGQWLRARAAALDPSGAVDGAQT